MTKRTAALRQFALQKTNWYFLSLPLWPKSPNTLRDILFVIFSCIYVTSPSALPLVLLPYTADVTDLFSVDDCGWLKRDAPVSTLLQGTAEVVQMTLGDKCGCLSVRFSVGICAYILLPRGRHPISAVLGRKTKQYVGAKMCLGWERITRPSDFPAVNGQYNALLYCAASHCWPTLGAMRMEKKDFMEGNASHWDRPEYQRMPRLFVAMKDEIGCKSGHLSSCTIYESLVISL